MSRSERIAALVAELDGEIAAGLDDGAIAKLPPGTARRLVGVAGRCWAVAAEEGHDPPSGTELSPTDAVVLATAALRSNDLNPFDLALWFSRSSS